MTTTNNNIQALLTTRVSKPVGFEFLRAERTILRETKMAPQNLGNSKIFDESGIHETYVDKTHQAILPKFATIDLERDLDCEISIESQSCVEMLFVVIAQRNNYVRGKSGCVTTNINSLTREILSDDCRLQESHPQVQAAKEADRKRKNTKKVFQTIFSTMTGLVFATVLLWNTSDPNDNSWNWVPAFMIMLGLTAIQGAIQAVINRTHGLNIEESFICPLPGIIPNDVREQLPNLRKKFGRLWIVCDAENSWVNNEKSGGEVHREVILIGEKVGDLRYIQTINLLPPEEFLRENEIQDPQST